MNVAFLILNLVLFSAVGWLLCYFYHDAPLRKWLFPTLLLKILAGIAIGLLYTYYYGTGDTLSYFHSAVMNDGAYTGQPRALFFVKILSFVNIVTGDNYWLSSVWFSLFSFSGLWLLANRLVEIFPKAKLAAIGAFFLFPSFVFWSSGIIKESLAIGAMAYVIASGLAYVFKKEKPSILHVLIDLAMILLLWQTKYYYAGLLLLSMASFVSALLIARRVSAIRRSPMGQLGVLVLFIVLFSLLVSQLHPNFYFDRVLIVIVDNNRAYTTLSDPEDLIIFENFHANWVSVLSNSPKAFISSLFKPMPGEDVGWLKMLSGIEHFFLLILVIGALFRIPSRLTNETRLLLFSALFYCIALGVFLALSTPNMGTLSRYRVGFLPILLFITFATYFKKEKE